MIEKCTSPLQGSHRSRKNSGLVLREDNWRMEATQGTPLHPGAKACVTTPTTQRAILATLQTPRHSRSGMYLFPALSAFPRFYLNSSRCRWNPSLTGSWGLLSMASTWLWRVEMGALRASKYTSLAPPACLLSRSRSGVEGVPPF